MRAKDKKVSRMRFAGAYVSSVISISLVLLLVGIGSLLLLNAGAVSDFLKESVRISVLFRQEVSEKNALAYMEEVKSLPCVKDVRYVSREEGTAELKKLLGDDFLSVFETSPVPLSLEVALHAEYVASDSLGKVIPVFEESALVDEVDCQQSLVEALNANVAKISLVLSLFVILMLFISFVLINNTVRLSVFDRRFAIHTMKLVGATKDFIRRPFLWRALAQGLLSSGFSLLILASLMLVLRSSFAELFKIFSVSVMVLTAFIVVAGGAAICLLSTYFTVGRLIRLKKEDLYNG